MHSKIHLVGRQRFFVFRIPSFWSLALATVLLSPPSLSKAHVVTYNVNLNGVVESPPNASTGLGSGTVVFDEDLVTMTINLEFSGLLGSVTAAHIHAATPNPFAGTAGVATQLPSFVGFPLGVNNGVYTQTFDLADAASYNPAFITASGGTVSDALNGLLFAAEAGKAYFNIHTSAFPGGEIRGFLTAVPEPSSFALAFVAGAAALSCLQIRQPRIGR